MHALATLPDSISARRNLLSQVVGSLPAGNPVRDEAIGLLKTLHHHDVVQAKFSALMKGGLQ